MTLFIAVAAIAAFVSAAGVARQLLALTGFAAIIAGVWAVANGGVPAAQALAQQCFTLAMGQRVLVAGAVLGLVLGRPLAALLNPSHHIKEY